MKSIPSPTVRAAQAVLLAFLLVAVMSAATTSGASAARQTCVVDCVTTYDVTVPSPSNGPFAITRGPLDSEWFAWGDAVGRIDDDGVIFKYPVPTVDPFMRWIIAGSDRKVWFTELNKVGWIRTSTSGTQLREYALPHSVAQVISLVQAPDGRLYFSEQAVGKIGQLNPRTGRLREYTVPSGDPLGLTLGPDRALWFVERGPEKVGRMSLNGRVREWSLPTGAQPQRITLGQDGALWFTELGTSSLGRITTTGDITHYPIPGGPVGITAGRDGQLYTTLFRAGALARVNLHGQETGRWALPGATFALQNGRGEGWDIWATDTGSPEAGGHVYRVTPYQTSR